METLIRKKTLFSAMTGRAVCVSAAAAAVMLTLAATAGSAGAAVLSGNITIVTNDNTNSGSDADDFELTTLGTTDWAYWNGPANSNNWTTSLAPAAEKTGADLIGSMYPISNNPADDSTVRGSSSTSARTAHDIYVNGTRLTSDNGGVGGFDSDLNTIGNGVGFTITLPTTGTYTVKVWVGIYGQDGAKGKLTASLPGAADYVDATLLATSYSNLEPWGDGHSGYYTLTVQADHPNDALTLRYALSSDSGSSYDRTQIVAAAVSAVPEPATAALMALGMMTMLSRRSRQD